MKTAFSIFFLLTIFLMNIETHAQTAKDFAKIWDKQHISKLPPSTVRHKDLQDYLEQLKTLGLPVAEVGKSYGGREIYRIEWGKGAAKVFMWSQMHGDEPTATSALMDMLAFLKTNRNKLAWVKKLEKTITLRVVPMLNPDGAELYQRRNLQGIDINRDAVNLQTPEGQLLKKLRDEWKPEIGFNLHNQNPLTTVGKTNKQASISLLAVSGDPAGKSNKGHIRSKRISVVILDALNQFIKGNIARYDDEYNPRAFGDRISEWGTPVILIETGALQGKDEMFLVKMNFIAYLAALQSVATGSEKKADPKIYDTLPFNGSGSLYNIIFRHATIINYAETAEPFLADIGINAQRRRATDPTPTFVQDIGDLSIYTGLEEYNVKDFYLIPKNGLLKIGAGGEFLLYKKSRQIDWKAQDLETQFPPDAIFKDGKWIKPIEK
jgi:Zinc carboxypeptidase